MAVENSANHSSCRVCGEVTAIAVPAARISVANTVAARPLIVGIAPLLVIGIDFSRFPLDEPLPELTTNGHQSSLARWIGKTPRELVKTLSSKDGIDFTGTPDYVGGLMAEIMQEVGGDGFLIFNSYFDRRYVIEVCDGLVPELQRRGLTRKAYAHKHLKDNLLEF